MSDRRDQVWVPAGEFTMGSDAHYPEEAPARRVRVDGAWMGRAPVTNAQYAAFVADTGYVTVAERPLDPADFPGAPAENLVPGSMVFVPTAGPVDLRHLSQWWAWVPGASWRAPRGPGAGADAAAPGGELAEHPVVHVAWEDAAAYAEWVGGELPTEAQWEHAARGGLDGAAFVWGDEPEADVAAGGEARANYWHGEFPWRAAPGYGATTPVGRFPANGYGLVDVAGNVWEWTSDWYAARPAAEAKPKPGACCVPHEPRGPAMEASFDPAQPQFAVPRRVVKGGSFLCADSYCMRYRPAARRPQMVDTGMSHIGFRVLVRGGGE